MTLQQFLILSEDKRREVLVHQAVLIGTIQDDEGTYTLFQIHGFYLEVLRNINRVIVSSICYFDETVLLDPYLASINIDEVYEIIDKSKI